MLLLSACGDGLTNLPETSVPVSIPDADAAQPIDAGVEAAAYVDASANCRVSGRTPGTLAEELVDGVWHFKEGSGSSWIRMNMTAAMPQGPVLFRPVRATGYFPCAAGTGSGAIDATAKTATLQLPSGCSNESRTYRFLCVGDANQGGYAEREAFVIETRADGSSRQLRIVRYPSTYCSKDLTSCSEPDGV